MRRIELTAVKAPVVLCAALSLATVLTSATTAKAVLITSDQTFESFNPGVTVNGQGSWGAGGVGGAAASVVNASVTSVVGGTPTADVYDGSQALVVTDSSTAGAPTATYTGTGTIADTVAWYAKAGATNTAMFMTFTSSASLVAINRIGFQSDGTFDIRPAGSELSAATYNANEWYKFEVTFDASAGTRGTTSGKVTNLAGVTQTSWTNQAFMSSPAYVLNTPISLLKITGTGSDQGTIYVDNLTSVPEPASAGLLALGGLLLGRRRRDKQRQSKH